MPAGNIVTAPVPWSDDPALRAMYFFTEVGAAGAWRIPHVHVLGTGQYLVMPPAYRQRPPGPYWLISPSVPPRLTASGLLCDAVAPLRGAAC